MAFYEAIFLKNGFLTESFVKIKNRYFPFCSEERKMIYWKKRLP